ncbi:MAG: prenyltransferase/squalene oxidase repeat-containing protein [Planctomycetota bacterium]
MTVNSNDDSQNRIQQLNLLCRQARKAVANGKRLNIPGIVEKYSHLQPELEHQLRRITGSASPREVSEPAAGTRGLPVVAKRVEQFQDAPSTQPGAVPTAKYNTSVPPLNQPVALPASKRAFSWVKVLLIGLAVCVFLWLSLFAVTYFVLKNRYDRQTAENQAGEEVGDQAGAVPRVFQTPVQPLDPQGVNSDQAEEATSVDAAPTPSAEDHLVEHSIALPAGEQLVGAEAVPLDELPLDEININFGEVELHPLEEDVRELQPMEGLSPEQDFAEAGDFDALQTEFLGVFGARNGQARQQAVARYGVTAESEEAVQKSLQWIAGLQNSNGSWNLDLTVDGNPSGYDNPGELGEALNGATALALLPFLGAGNTHLEGDYSETVSNGLQYLLANFGKDGRGMSWHEDGGSMYSHGLVALALCEAYEMTRDPNLEVYAQNAIEYIELGQDPAGGGWRYFRGQPGDLSVTGWQMSALFAAEHAGLDINRQTYEKAASFLDSVTSNGTFYGYQHPTRDGAVRKAMTAIGLYCRLHYGWTPEDPRMQEGLDWLLARGPSVGSRTNTYDNYYLTLLMHNSGDYYRSRWHPEMMRYLIENQEADGSWMFNPENHTESKGGRLTVTALNCLILETPYRHVPLHGSGTVARFDLPQ